MALKLLKSTRQKRIASHSTSRSIPFKRLGVVLLIIFLVALLVCALLFLQANKATSDLKNTNKSSRDTVQNAVEQATTNLGSVNIQNRDQANTVAGQLTELSTSVDSVSESCVDASKPIVPVFAKNYQMISDECGSITKAAREIRDATNAFLPIAEYHTSLSSALDPVIEYHRGDQKTDIQRGVDAWDETYAQLQQVAAPTELEEVHSGLINTSQSISELLQRALTEKESNPTQYAATLDQVEAHYGELNQYAEPINASLKEAQQQLTQAAKSIR